MRIPINVLQWRLELGIAFKLNSKEEKINKETGNKGWESATDSTMAYATSATQRETIQQYIFYQNCC